MYMYVHVRVYYNYRTCRLLLISVYQIRRLPLHTSSIVIVNSHRHYEIYNFHMLHAQFKRQCIYMYMYLANCWHLVIIIQYAQVVPPEAEKHTSPYIFYGIPLLPQRIPSANSLCTNVNPLRIARQWGIAAIHKNFNYCTF